MSKNSILLNPKPNHRVHTQPELFPYPESDKSNSQPPNLFVLYTGLFEMIVGVLTTCHTQYTSDSSICIFLFNRTTLQVFVTYLTGALYVHPL